MIKPTADNNLNFNQYLQHKNSFFLSLKNQTGSIVHLEAVGLVLGFHLVSRVTRKSDFAYAKTKKQISFAVTMKLISAFVFATRTV